MMFASSFVISVVIAVVVVGAVSILLGAVLLWRSGHAAEPAARSGFKHAIGFASLSGWAVGMLSGLLEATAIAYVVLVQRGQLHLFRLDESVVLTIAWVLVGWVVGVIGSILATLRKGRAGTIIMPSIRRNMVWQNTLLCGALLIVWALLVHRSITSDEAVQLVVVIPIGGFAFTSRLHRWMDQAVDRHQRASVLASLIFGVLLLASLNWFP